ncbi:glycosyltransferase [Dongia sedimenti]|uniref:Glycosyltransferase n=1 Tax=Dongia sedimenti TaxID=3064282 RepID=A0ABU0YQC8_9PROT|nr:glycosyltransferase [Rhodospirillaceae bacterium R-7]
MRILFASPHVYLPDSTSGREISTHEQALRWHGDGIAVAVLAERPGLAGLTRDEALGYPIYRAADPRASFNAVLADWRPEIAVYPHDAQGQALAVAGLQAGVRAALHVTNVDAAGIGGSPLAHPETIFITVSDFAARRIDTLLGIRPPVVPPLIEPERYRVAQPGDAVLLVNPSLRKGVELFFRMAEARPDIPFLAVESWNVHDVWRTVLMNRARALNNVELWPAVEDMREAYARARLILMPSIHEETFGRVVAEAQISGIPALVSDRGALPETLGGGGIAVPLDAGLEAWLAALDRLWTDPTFYGRCAAAARAESTAEGRDPARVSARFLGLLRRF